MPDRITLITGNAGKAAEYAAMLGIKVTPAMAELTEVQSLDVAHVAARKAADAYDQLREPVLVDDTGLTDHPCVERPARRPCRMVPRHRRPARHPEHGRRNHRPPRDCQHRAWLRRLRRSPGIHRTVDGSLATEPRGTSGFGYDPIFIPDSDSGHLTYAQMTSEEKNKIFHRRRAVEAMRSGLGLE